MSSEPELWTDAPQRPLLTNQEVHIWRVSLQQVPATRATLFQLLSPDERQRALRYHFPHDRDHFIIARGALRETLSRYLGISPAALSFAYNQYGKPALQLRPGDAQLRFNVTHSGELALYAVTLERRVGLDLEYMRAELAGLEIAARFFSPRELKMLRELPQEMQTVGFFNCWTRKEAYIKAIGEGLSHALDQFAVSLAPGERPALLDVNSDPQAAARWSLFELQAGAGYAAALALEGDPARIQCWQWHI